MGDMGNPLFATLIDDYLHSKRALGVSRKTVKIYEDALRGVLAVYCDQIGVVKLSDLSNRHLDMLSAGLLDGTRSRSGRPLSKATVHCYMRAVNTFLLWATKQGEAITAKAQRPTLPRRLLDVLSREEIRTIEDAASKERDKLIVRMLADTGMRLGELLGLTPADIRTESGRRHFIKVRGKGDRERMVPIQPGLAARIDRYAARTRKASASPRLFLGNRRRRMSGEYEPLTESGAEQMIRELAVVAGITKRVYPHLFRHSFVTEQLRRGMTPSLVARIVGHSSLAMIDQVYQHLTIDDAHEALMRSLVRDDR